MLLVADKVTLEARTCMSEGKNPVSGILSKGLFCDVSDPCAQRGESQNNEPSYGTDNYLKPRQLDSTDLTFQATLSNTGDQGSCGDVVGRLQGRVLVLFAVCFFGVRGRGGSLLFPRQLQPPHMEAEI